MKEKNNTFSQKAKVWVYPGLGGWHFVTLTKELSEKIKKVSKPYGAGFVRIQAKVGKSSWETALFPHTKSGTYLLAIKKNIRKKEGIFADDEIGVSVVLI